MFECAVNNNENPVIKEFLTIKSVAFLLAFSSTVTEAAIKKKSKSKPKKITQTVSPSALLPTKRFCIGFFDHIATRFNSVIRRYSAKVANGNYGW